MADPALPPLLAGRRVAVARDAAYGFIYPANIETLQVRGQPITQERAGGGRQFSQGGREGWRKQAGRDTQAPTMCLCWR